MAKASSGPARSSAVMPSNTRKPMRCFVLMGRILGTTLRGRQDIDPTIWDISPRGVPTSNGSLHALTEIGEHLIGAVDADEAEARKLEVDDHVHRHRQDRREHRHVQ